MKKSMTRLLSGLLVLFLVISVGCGNKAIPSDTKGFKYLSNERLDYDAIISTVKELTSEKYEGRLAGGKGNTLAEDYIVNYFENIGLEKPEKLGSYKQPYKQLTMINNSTPMLQILDKSGKVIKDYLLPYNFTNSGGIVGSAVKGEVSAEGIVIMSKSELEKVKDNIAGKVLLVSKEARTEFYQNSNLMSMIKGKGVKGLLLEVDVLSSRNMYKHLPISPYAMEPTSYDNDNGPLVASVESTSFMEMVNSVKLGNQVHMKSDYTPTEVEVSNIIGVIPGSDEKLKNEYIIVSGHLDHVGNNQNGTYNSGALDNASGVATFMEIAKAIKNNKTPPKKTIVFIAFNGEEEGLYGAYHLASNPVFPINPQNAVVINLDMVGSKNIMPLTLGNYNELDTKLREDLYVFAKDLNIEVEKAMESASDHTPFAEIDIPALTVINMDIENPAYHTPKDTLADVVDRDRIGEVAKLILYYIDHRAY